MFKEITLKNGQIIAAKDGMSITYLFVSSKVND